MLCLPAARLTSCPTGVSWAPCGTMPRLCPAPNFYVAGSQNAQQMLPAQCPFLQIAELPASWRELVFNNVLWQIEQTMDGWDEDILFGTLDTGEM